MISRRSFFAGLGALVAAPAIVKVTSLMPVRGIVMVRPNYLTIAEITREAVRLFLNNSTFIANIDRQYDELFAAQEFLIRLPNETIEYRYRPRFVAEPEWLDDLAA